MRNAVTDVPTRVLISVIGAICLSAFLSQPVAGSERDLAESDWSATAKHSLANDPPSAQAVAAFLNRLAKKASIGLPTEPADFRFADLRGSGTLSLVLLGGAAHCGDARLIVIDKTSLGFEVYAGDASQNQIAQILKDLDRTGKYELVPELTLFFQDCASGGPRFPVIYAWTGVGYGNVSERFPEFYKHKLQSLESNIEAAEAELARAAAAKREAWENQTEVSRERIGGMVLRLDRGADPQLILIQPAQPTRSVDASQVAAPHTPPELVAAYGNEGNYWRIEAAKIKRFLGISRDAGIGYAISLAKSDDSRDRVLAAEIFADIPTPEAEGYLRTLSRDSEPPVAGRACYLLRSPKFQPDAQFPMGFVPFRSLGPGAGPE